MSNPTANANTASSSAEAQQRLAREQHPVQKHRVNNAKKGVDIAGGVVEDVSKGLGGKKNPVGGIVGKVADGLKRGAGEKEV